MRQAVTAFDLRPIIERLGKALRDRTDALTREQLPERWVDLIRYLDEKERQRSDAANRKPPPEY
jgi:hypothetical protein